MRDSGPGELWFRYAVAAIAAQIHEGGRLEMADECVGDCAGHWAYFGVRRAWNLLAQRVRLCCRHIGAGHLTREALRGTHTHTHTHTHLLRRDTALETHARNYAAVVQVPVAAVADI